MAWGSSFDKAADKAVENASSIPEGWAADAKLLNDVLMQDGAIHPPITAWDLGTGDKTVLACYENGRMTFKELTKEEVSAKWPAQSEQINPIPRDREYTNKVPTHDPYTNPNAHIYYECNCGQILDPGTKRFAELNNCASRAGWKIRFSDNGYIPYCVECGKGVE